jgi:hypothetical protein
VAGNHPSAYLEDRVHAPSPLRSAVNDATISLTRAGFDLAHRLLARGSFHHPIKADDIDCAALPELVRKKAAKVHDAAREGAGTIEMLVTEMDLDLAVQHMPR